MKRFDNIKELNEYLRNKAKEGEIVMLDERATEIHQRRKLFFRKRENVKRE